MTEKTLTTENIKSALDALRGELAPWPVVAMKQDKLNNTQKSAVNSGITSSLVAQIIANTAAIRALESAITGTGLRALVVSSLPAVGTTGILYIVPVTTYDPDTDADVVNYSNEYIWIPVEGGTASEGHYEQVGQTGVVINNGQLTITVNGTSVGTFTANQSGDTTAAITVPTNADYVDLSTNQTVAGVKTFSSTIEGTAAKAIADEDGTSIKTGYVNVAGNQTVSGDKSWTGSNTFNNILPNATNTYSLGSSSYQWSSVYAQSYYYNGTAWGLDQANIWTRQQQIDTGSNTTDIYFNSFHGQEEYNTYGTSSYKNYNCFLRRDSNKFDNSIGIYRSVGILGDTEAGATVHDIDTSFAYYDIHINYKYMQIMQNTQFRNDGTTNQVIPSVTNTTDLGTSTNKWKTLNGVNPGALSLPDLSKQVTLDVIPPTGESSVNWSGGANTFTPPANGWISIRHDNCKFIQVYQNTNNRLGVTSERSSYGKIVISLPVLGGSLYSLFMDAQSGTVHYLFYPCLGNV